MSKRIFDYHGYPCAPTDIADDTWFYVQKIGIIICGRSSNGDPCEQAVMPWRMVKRALADHEKAKERKK